MFSSISFLPRLQTVVFILVGFIAASSPAFGQSISSQAPSSIAKFLEDRGQTVIVTVDEFDDPFIETSVDNVDYNIFFYGCSDNAACTSISMRAQRISPGEASTDVLNGWNRDQRWTKVYSGDINSIIMEMDFLFEESLMDAMLFEAKLDLWERSLAQFVSFVDDGDYDYVD